MVALLYVYWDSAIISFNLMSSSCLVEASDSFTILGLWVLGLAVSNINESQLQTYESKTLFLMVSGRFGRESFRPGRFGLILGWVVSAYFGGSFRPTYFI